MKQCPWFVSLHGGHSREYCDHASDTLSDMIERAIERGMVVYGISEHAPRYEEHYIYPEERAMHWTLEKIQNDFDKYAQDSRRYVEKYGKRIMLLRAFEIEVAPRAHYVERMLSLRHTHGFDYIVGSVHYVNDRLFDHRDMFEDVVREMGGIEKMVLKYYEQLMEMVLALKPEIVAHLDVYRKYAGNVPELESAAVKRAAQDALEAVRQVNAILDINTGAYRKGLATPYPAPWIIKAARERGIAFCFGDDSHCCADVGCGIDRAKDYLLENGIFSIRVLKRDKGRLYTDEVPLR